MAAPEATVAMAMPGSLLHELEAEATGFFVLAATAPRRRAAR